MNILITNLTLKNHTGTELYVRDLALELRRQGHSPAIFTSMPGEIAEELRASGIPVANDLRSLEFEPDIIHGHHRTVTSAALSHYSRTPAIYISHSHNFWPDGPTLHPRIYQYFGVSMVCVERLRADGVPEGRIGFLPNFVDSGRFRPRPPLPDRPLRALIFSNYATSDTHLPAVAEACRRAGLELDVVGSGVGNCIAQPEAVLGQYDIVFAKAKAAMEAMAVGTAVILCDFSGVGPMVTSVDFERLRPLNFGFAALTAPLQPESVLAQIARYDPADATKVRDLLRSSASIDQAVATLTQIYRQVIQEHAASSQDGAVRDTYRHRALLARDALAGAMLNRWQAIPQGRRDSLCGLPGFNTFRRGLGRIMFALR